jgi:hypothetical protein
MAMGHRPLEVAAFAPGGKLANILATACSLI